MSNLSGVVSVTEYAETFLGSKIVKKKDLVDSMQSKLGRKPPRWLWQPCQRVERGVYTTEWQEGNKFKETTVRIPEAVAQPTQAAPVADDAGAASNVTPISADPVKSINHQEHGTLIPNKFVGFFSTPQYSQIRQIVGSGVFFPVYVTGDTGGGKTLAVRQACAVNKREMIRVNITSATSDVHLLGSYKLIDGHMVWQDGPVVTAMRRGSVLLLDEIDLGTDRILCLQSVLEGESVLLDRTGEVVEPAPGFNVIATANTKGRVDASTSKFAGTRTLNEAFLDRFSMTIEYPYPTEKTEYKILNGAFDRALAKVEMTRDDKSDNFFQTFFAWVRSIRESYLNGSAEAHVSTRRAESILTSYAIFGGNIKKAIMGGVSRFDQDTRDSFLRLFNGLLEESDDLDWSDFEDEDGEAE